MAKIKLSVVLAVRNEELNIGRCLQSVKEIADEIIVVDEKSIDKTATIAKEYKAKVIEVEHSDNFHVSKNKAIEAAGGDWILQLDADEVVSSELAKEIRLIVNSEKNTINGYWVNRKNWFLSRFLTKGGQYPDPTLRLYRRGFGKLPAKDVHEQAVVSGEIGHLKNDLLHYRDVTFEKYMQGFNRYSSFIASQMTGVKTSFKNSIVYLIVKPTLVFLKIYIRHRGYVDGFPGLIFALFSGLIYPVAYIKNWQTKSI